jgi:TorA maturation chaperone TorD
MKPSETQTAQRTRNGTGGAPQTGAVATALRLFASIFQREPDGTLIRELDERRDELLSALGTDPLAGLDLADLEAAEEALAVDYCQLFIGPNTHLPPVESMARGEGRFWGRSTQAVVAAYKELGIGIPDETRQFPDHVAMELDCLALLEEQDRHEQAAAFARKHLLRWLPALVAHVESNARTAFYPVWAAGLATMLQDLYGEEG